MESIQFATGKKSYSIKNEDGSVRGVIRFNPTDVNFLNQFLKLEAICRECVSNIQKLNDNDTEEHLISTLVSMDDDIKAAIDETFGKDASEIMFEGQSVFNRIGDDETLLQSFLENFLPIVEADLSDIAKKSNTKASKYLASVSEA